MNEQISHRYNAKFIPKKRPKQTNNTLIILTFSGGGTRAAAFSYGVLKGLHNTQIKQNGKYFSVLSEVDIISAVSGGSFTAAYYGLFGNKIFMDYETKFLKHPIQSELIREWLLSPKNWRKLGSDFFNRTDLAAEYYDKQIFEGKKFSDIRDDMPSIIINTTDISAGTLFSFIPSNMNWICSDLSSYSVSRAVAASSAVPGLFSPIMLKNFEGCKNNSKIVESRKYQNKQRYPYLHLIDGGISDNLGIRSILRVVKAHDNDFPKLLNSYNIDYIDKIAIIVVDSSDDIPPYIAKTAKEPSIEDTIGAVTTLQSRRYNTDTLLLLREETKRWKKQLDVRCIKKAHQQCQSIDFHIIELNLKQLPKLMAEKTSFYKTSLELPTNQVDTLIYAGQYLLRHSKLYQDFVNELNE